MRYDALRYDTMLGTNGATAADVLPCFADGHGALATASRSVIFPSSNSDWQTEIAKASRKLADELRVTDFA